MIIAANLDAEVSWAGGPPLPAAVTARLALLATTLRIFAGDGDALWLPAAVDPGAIPDDDAPHPPLLHGPLPGGATIGCAWAATSAVASPATAAIARTVNHRGFAADLATRLGIALPGARLVTTTDELAAHLAAGGAAASPTGTWVAKAAWTAAGRDRVRRTGTTLDDATRTRLDRLLALHGTLAFEPWMARTLDVGQGGDVGASGAITLLPPHRGLVDASGTIRGVAVDGGATLDDGERRRLAATARAAGETLFAAGYRGPFVIDGFVHDRGGDRVLHPMCELNARLTFGLVAHAWARHRGTPLTLGLGGPMPAGGAALVHGPDGPAAWIATSG